MNKKLFISLFWVLPFLLQAGGGAAADTGSDGEAATGGGSVDLSVAYAFPKADASAQVVLEWQKRVSERTNGRVSFTNYWSQSLVPLKDAPDATAKGIADIAMVTSSYTSGRFPALAPLDIPFALPEDPARRAEVQAKVNEIIDDMFTERANQKVIFGLVHPPSFVTCKDGFLPTADSWKGKVVRTPGGYYARTFGHLGAELSFIPLQDIYLSLQMNTVDCALLVYTAMEGMKVYEVSPYSTRIDHSNLHSVMTMNLDRWNELSPSDQEIMLEAGREVESMALETRPRVIEESMQRIVDGGGKFCIPDRAHIQAIKDAARAELDQLSYKLGSSGARLKDAVLEGWTDEVYVASPGADTALSDPCE
ncbi:MAG: TRAP transporter substrate-binding protein DctP [Gammaproteobacteria bacterium]|nr:TRAP transporter substrate-binding protein DctP [Gammaproteobacteria bacterium]